MRASCISYTDVSSICNKLTHENAHITLRSIRKELGSGSLSTIGKYLKTWEKTQKTTIPPNCLAELKLVPPEADLPPSLGVADALQLAPEASEPTLSYPSVHQSPASVHNEVTEETQLASEAPKPVPPHPPVLGSLTSRPASVHLAVRAKNLLLKVVYSVPALVFQVALILFLIEDSARFFAAAGQHRPLMMAIFTEAALLFCSIISPRKKSLWLLNKVMLGSIIVFIIFLMSENTHSQQAHNFSQHDSLTREISSLEKNNSGIRASISDLEARSRVSAAVTLQGTLAANQERLKALHDQQRTLTKPISPTEANIMFFFRLGAVIFTLLLAGYQRSLWAKS